MTIINNIMGGTNPNDGDQLSATDLTDTFDASATRQYTINVEAGENIPLGSLVYFHLTDGKAYLSDSATSNDLRSNGIATTGVSSGEDVTVLIRGIYPTTGLTDKQEYYLGASGILTTARSGVRVGMALSTTQLFVDIIQDDRDIPGTIKFIDKSASGFSGGSMITAFWTICSGGVLSDAESPFDGESIPNMTGSESFIRGNTDSGSTGGATAHSHTISVSGPAGPIEDGAGYRATTDPVSSLPTYITMVPYKKIK